MSYTTEIISTSCQGCGAERKGRRADVLRSDFCRLCAVRKRFAERPRRSREDKRRYQASYYQANRAKLDAYRDEKRRQARLDLLELLGGPVCAHCGIEDEVVMNVDHINDDANGKHDVVAETLLRRIRKGADFADRYQVLCCNCNWRKEFNRRRNASEK